MTWETKRVIRLSEVRKWLMIWVVSQLGRNCLGDTELSVKSIRLHPVSCTTAPYGVCVCAHCSTLIHVLIPLSPHQPYHQHPYLTLPVEPRQDTAKPIDAPSASSLSQCPSSRTLPSGTHLLLQEVMRGQGLSQEPVWDSASAQQWSKTVHSKSISQEVRWAEPMKKLFAFKTEMLSSKWVFQLCLCVCYNATNFKVL